MKEQGDGKQASKNYEADYPLPIYEMTMRLDAVRKTLEDVAHKIGTMNSDHASGWGWLCPWERNQATTAALDVLLAMAVQCRKEADHAAQAAEAGRGRFADLLKTSSATARAQVSI